MTRDQRTNETFLYGGNVTHLYDRPLYLYPNLNYRLTVTIEQEPLKLFDVFNMTTAAQRAWLLATEGISEPYILPYIVQCRGVWRPLEDTNGYPGEYKWLFEPSYPNQPTDYLGTTPARNRLYMLSKRSFIPRVDIYIAGELQTSVTAWHGSSGTLQESVTTARGTLSCISTLTMNGTPHEALYQYAETFYTGTTPGGELINNYNHGNAAAQGGGEGYEYRVTCDGYGRMVVTVDSEHREIELRCSVEQVQTNVPCDMGFCGVESCTSWGFNVDASGIWEQMIEYGNPVGYHGAGVNDPFLGAEKCYDTVDWTPAGAPLVVCWPICTAWDVTGSSSTNNQWLDWDSIGNPGTHKLHHLCFYTSRADHDNPFSPPVEKVGIHGIGTPLIIGVDKPEGPFASFLQLSNGTDIDPTADNNYAANGQAIIKGLYAAAQSREAYNEVQQGPRVKVTVFFEQIDPDTDVVLDSYLNWYYCNLPYHWSGASTRRPSGAFVKSTDIRYDFYNDGVTTHTIQERESSDWHCEGTIGAGTVYFSILGDGDGVDIAKTGGTLGPLYADANSYIYYPTDGSNTYAAFRGANP